MVTHSRPFASNAIWMGFWMSGSLATSCTSNPAGTVNAFRSSAGDSASVGAMRSGGRFGGFGCANSDAASASEAVRERTNRMSGSPAGCEDGVAMEG